MKQTFNSGCILSKKDIRDYRLSESVCGMIFPDNFSILKEAKVKNQKAVPSCVAHALSTILESYDEGLTLSTNFIYGNKSTGSPTGGMSLSDACKIARKYGDPLEEECPGNNVFEISSKIAKEAMRDPEVRLSAEQHRIKYYATISTEAEIKTSLMNYGPVLVAVPWYADTHLWDGRLTHSSGRITGYHAMVICGWTPRGYIIHNSWGSTWGVNGKAILPYDYKISEAKSIVDREEVLVKPHNRSFLRLVYKAINFVVNLFRK